MSEKYRPFSERHGHTQPKLPQREEMDDDLRAGLWNAFYRSFPQEAGSLHPIYMKIFVNFLKNNIDEYLVEPTVDTRVVIKQKMMRKMIDNQNIIKESFLKKESYEVYELIEFVMENSNDDRYKNLCNVTLEQENSAYRIVDKFVTPITSELEMGAVEAATQIRFEDARGRVEGALRHLSDRKNPKYRNSIADSIHAVESIAKEITGKDDSLNALTQSLKLHPNLTNGLNELYNWTSKDGIRHAKSGKPLSVNQDTARFMLVTCSAFVNYIVAKNPK